MGKVLIVGAGAIGRGFVPWVLEGFEVDFLDSSKVLVEEITRRNGYTSWRSKDGALESKWVCPGKITADPADLNLASYDLAFIAVGPRNVSKISNQLEKLNCPIFSLENDPVTVSELARSLKMRDVYFGVPDVITSATAAPENLLKDPCAIHTEDGQLYLEAGSGVSLELREELPNVVWSSREEMIKEWDAKLFLHNTPHCVAAYLGHLLEKDFVHEGFENAFLTEVVEGVISEMLMALKLQTSHDHYFLEEYAKKELRRFSNPLLFDPISRVAREPLRKLMPEGRLTGALTLTLLSGVRPQYLQLGIIAALNYDKVGDSDYAAVRVRHLFELSDFLEYHLGLRAATVESQYICANYKAGFSWLKERLK